MFVIILKEQRNDLAATAGRFFCRFFPFLCCKYNEKIKKIKKNQKKSKKMRKNLHNSKICCTFAPNLKNNPKKVNQLKAKKL